LQIQFTGGKKEVHRVHSKLRSRESNEKCGAQEEVLSVPGCLETFFTYTTFLKVGRGMKLPPLLFL
jgi:hypothetical protein